MGEECGRGEKKQLRACVPYCFPGRFPPLTDTRPWQTAPLRTLCFLGGVRTPCKEAAVGNSTSVRAAHQVTFQSSSSPEGAPFFGCRGCTWMVRSWSRPHSRSQGRDTSSPALSAGPEFSLRGPRLLRLWGRDTSPGHQDFRYRALALSFFFLLLLSISGVFF